MEKLDSSWKSQVTPAKGTHIMLPRSAFETNSAPFLPARDGRYVFVIPWQRALMVGTTDTPYKGSLDNPLADEDEIEYFLSTLDSYAREDRRILFRRMRLGLIHQAQCLNAASKVARCVHGVVGWDDARRQAELKALTATLGEHLN